MTKESIRVDGLKVIEKTKLEDVSEAMETFNRNGIVSDLQMLYTRVIYEYNEKELCKKLADLGFYDEPKIASIFLPNVGNCHAVYNSNIYNVLEAVEWLKSNYEAEMLLE